MARASSPVSPAMPEEAQSGRMSVHCVEASSVGPELAGRLEEPPPQLQLAGHEERRWSLQDTDAWWIAGGRGRRQGDRRLPQQGERAASPTDHLFDALDVDRDGVISSGELNRVMAEAEQREDRQEPPSAQRHRRRSVSLDPSRGTRWPSTERASLAPAPSRGTVVLVRRPSSGRSGRLSARHRDAIERAGNSTMVEPVQDLEPWSSQRSTEPESSHLREVVPPAAARMAEEVLSQEVEGLGECLNICAERSRTLKLLGFQHLKYDARLQSILKTKAQKLGLQVVTELLLLARSLFAFREAARHGFLWERLQDRERCLASTTRDVTGLRKLHHKARSRMCSQLDRSASLAKRTLLQYCFAELVKQGMQVKLHRLWSSNCAMQEHAACRRRRVPSALEPWLRDVDRRAISWCFASWATACAAFRIQRRLQSQCAGMGHRVTVCLGEVSLAQCLGAWGRAARLSLEAASRLAAAASWKRNAAVSMERQLATAKGLLVSKYFCAWGGECEHGRAARRRRDLWAAQSMRFMAVTGEMLLAMCFLAFAAQMRNEQVSEKLNEMKASVKAISATRKRYLGAYFRHFSLEQEVLVHSAFIGWYTAVGKAKKERDSQQKIAALISHAFAASVNVLLSQILNAWELEADRTKNEWLLEARQDQMQEWLNASRNASMRLALKQAGRMYLSWARRTVSAFLTAWGGLCDNARTRAKVLCGHMALAQRAIAGGHRVLRLQAFRGWMEVVEREKYERQLELSSRRASLARASNTQVIASHCLRTFAFCEQSLLSLNFVHWGSVVRRRRGLQTTLALASRAFLGCDAWLLQQVFVCWATGKDNQKYEGQLLQVTDRLQKCRAASKENAEKLSRRTGLSLEQEALRIVTNAWRRVSESAVRTRRRKEKDMAHALMVIAASELYTLATVFHGWHRATCKKRNLMKTKQHAAVHFDRRISEAERLHLVRCFSGWGQVAAVARVERLEASLREAEEKIERGRDRTLKAMERQLSCSDGLLLQATFAAWHKAERTERSKMLCTNQVMRNSSAFDMVLKAQCFAVLASEAAAFKAELQLREANASVGDLRGLLEEKMLEVDTMEEELARQHAIRLSTTHRHLKRADQMMLQAVFSGWNSAASQAQAAWQSKERNLKAAKDLIKCSEELILKDVVNFWRCIMERTKHDVQVGALQKRMDIQGLAIAENMKRRQKRLLEALKRQFDFSGHQGLDMVFQGWKGRLDHMQRSLRRREELAGRTACLLLDSATSLLAFLFGVWHGSMLESRRLRICEDQVACARKMLLAGVERALDMADQALLRAEWRCWSLAVRAGHQGCAQKELISSHIHRTEMSANSCLLLLCCDSWSRAVLMEKFERTVEANQHLEQANARSVEMAAKAMQGAIGTLSKQFQTSDQQAAANTFKEWKGFVSLLKKKAERRGRLAVEIEASHRVLLTQCFHIFARHANENKIEEAQQNKLLSREQHVQSILVVLGKLDRLFIAEFLHKWRDRISCKKKKEETNRVVMMWALNSGEGVLRKVFREWELTVMREKQTQQANQKQKNIMAFEQRQLFLSEQQFSAQAFREWRTWVKGVRRDRELRKGITTRALRSLVVANSMILQSCITWWNAYVQQEEKARERQQRAGAQALRRMLELDTALLTQMLAEWLHEASRAIRERLKKANGRVEEVQAQMTRMVSDTGHKALRFLNKQQAIWKRQEGTSAFHAWRLVTEQAAREWRWKEWRIVWVNRTVAAINHSRVAQCFHLWTDEAAHAGSERRMAGARTQLQEVTGRLDELKALRIKQKQDLMGLSRHFVEVSPSVAPVCLAAWCRQSRMTKEMVRLRKDNMARTLRSISYAGQALLGFAVDFWKNEAGHLRREHLLEAAVRRREELEASSRAAAGERRARTVTAIQRHLSNDQQHMSYWIFHSWYGWVLQIKTRRMAKQELGASCLERIANSFLALQSKFLLIWRCLAVKSNLERTLHDINRRLEEEQRAHAAAARKGRAYLAVLARQPLETGSLQLARCVNGWVRVNNAARHSRRRRAWGSLVAERANVSTERALLEQCIIVWAFFVEKAKHERRIEHFMRDMSDRASCEVQVANQRVHAAGICVDEARRAQAHTKGRTKERALSVATRAVSLLERAAWTKCFTSWCAISLAARFRKAGDERCKTLRAIVLGRARTAAGYSRRWLDDVILAQSVGIWRLAASLQVQLRQEQKLQRVAFTKACANIVKLRLRLHEQKFLYQWLRICPLKAKEPMAPLCNKSHDFQREPPQFCTRPASAREPRWSAGPALEHEPEPAPSPGPSPALAQRPASALETRRRPTWGQEALPGEETWRPWQEGKNGENCAPTQSLGLAGKVALANQLGMQQPQELVQLLEAERACAEGAAAAASATAALALASAAQSGPPRPASVLADRQQLARQAAASDLEYRRLLEQNRREIRGVRLEREREHSQPCLSWGVWRP